MLSDLVQEVDPFVTIGVALATIAVYYFVVYPLWYAPLSHIPGPPISALTQYWMLYHTWAEHRIRLTHELHRKYGPVVRLSPHEVSVADPELVKTIYVGNYDKSQFYGQFGAYGVLNTFSSLSKDAHIKRRKILNQLYSKSSVGSADVEAMTQKRIANVMSIVRENKARALDVYDVFHALAMDTVTGFILGDEHGSDFLKTQDYQMIENYRLQSAMWFWVTLWPRFIDMAMDKATKLATSATAAWCSAKTLKMTSDPEPNTVIAQLVKYGITGYEACAESQDHTAAGHETTGATLSFLTYHLSTDLKVQTKLREELREAFGEGNEEMELPYKQVDALPYLNGVVCETLRLYSAIPGAEPRIVPATGMQTRNVGVVPAGTIVSMQPWTMHRDPDAFPDPLKFAPERWYQSSPDQLRKMNRNFTAFGAGVRMCIGMNLALQEIKLIVASIYRIYTTELAPDFDENNMFIVDKYTTHPLGHQCVLKFRHV